MALQVVSGPLSATGASNSIPIPLNIINFNLSVNGTFVATYQVERSFDGTTWYPMTALGSQIYVFTAGCSEQLEEHEHGTVFYRLNVTSYTSGTLSYRWSY